MKPKAHDREDAPEAGLPLSSQHPIEWSDAFLLGNAQMDDMHMAFVEIVGRMQAADDFDLPGLMNQLEAHLVDHFDLEDRAMEDTAFPPRQCHMDEHRAVLRSVRDVKQRVTQGSFVECRGLVHALAEWFPSHADHLDSALAHWMTKLAFGGKPVVLRRNLKLRD